MIRRMTIGAAALLFATYAAAQQLSFREIPSATTGGAPIDVAEPPQGSPIFIELEGNKVGVLVQSGNVREYPIPTPDSGPMSIVYVAANTPACASGFEFWFTESRANRIGRVCYIPNFDFNPSLPSLTFLAEISIPTPNSEPRGIVLGQSSVIWFTEFEGNKIGRAQDVGATEFPVPTPGSGPSGIAFDSSTGMIWFTELRANKIGRLDPATGVITEFPIPTPNSGPVEIVISGGDFWFTESNAGKIGRISREGVITEYALPDPTSRPSGIEHDPNGGGWFTERAAGRIGRAKPDGTIKEFPLPTSSSAPAGISVGQRGFGGRPRIVVAESGADQLAVAEADYLVILGAGSTIPPGPGAPALWDTEIQVSNPEDYGVGVVLSETDFPGPCQRAFCGQISLYPPPHGTATQFISGILRGSAGLESWFASPVGLDIPTVQARVMNRENPLLSVQLPVVRYSTIASLDPAVLSFAGAEKSSAGARSNLFLTNLLPSERSMTALVEVFSPTGELLGSQTVALEFRRTIFLTDIVGRFGVVELRNGQVRVRKVDGAGLLWGLLATIREDGGLTATLGANP